MQAKTIFFPDLEKLIEYSVFVVVAILSSPCVGLLPRTKISLFLLSILTCELLSTPKIATFFLQSKLGCEKSEQESNSIP